MLLSLRLQYENLIGVSKSHSAMLMSILREDFIEQIAEHFWGYTRLKATDFEQFLAEAKFNSLH